MVLIFSVRVVYGNRYQRECLLLILIVSAMTPQGLRGCTTAVVGTKHLEFK